MPRGSLIGLYLDTECEVGDADVVTGFLGEEPGGPLYEVFWSGADGYRGKLSITICDTDISDRTVRMLSP